MSIKVMSELWEKSQHKGSELLLLLAIADYADDDRHAYPSIPMLARKLRLTERSVQLLIRKLCRHQALHISEGQGPHGRHIFTILPPENFTGMKSFHPEKSHTNGVKSSVENPSLLLDSPCLSPVPSPSPSLSPPVPEPSVKPSGGARASKRTNLTHFVPDDWDASSDLTNWALATFPHLSLPTELAKFRDYEFPRPHSDWDRAFRNWMRRAEEIRLKGRATPVRKGYQPLSPEDTSARKAMIDRLVKEGYADEPARTGQPWDHAKDVSPGVSGDVPPGPRGRLFTNPVPATS